MKPKADGQNAAISKLAGSAAPAAAVAVATAGTGAGRGGNARLDSADAGYRTPAPTTLPPVLNRTQPAGEDDWLRDARQSGHKHNQASGAPFGGRQAGLNMLGKRPTGLRAPADKYPFEVGRPGR